MAELVSSIHPKQGFHIMSNTAINMSRNSECSQTYLYFSLPSLIFVDPYELAHYDAFYTFKHWGPSDLELPVAALEKHNAIHHLLLNLTLREPRDDNVIEVKVPMHLRYGDLEKGTESGVLYHEEEVKWPTGFSLCHSSYAPEISASILPAEVLSVIPSQSTLVTIPRRPGLSHSYSVRVPVGRPADLAVVEFGTFFTLLLAFFYVTRACLGVSTKISAARDKAE